MAERRMFAKAITGSAKFPRMPATSRLLYYDLGMDADDDGCVEAFGVIRKTGATEDDLKVLVSKGFVQVINDDLVTYILHWNINNHIRKDRYHPGIYKTLIRPTHSIVLDSGNQLTTEESIDQDSIDQDSIGEARSAELVDSSTHECFKFVPPTVEMVSAYCAERQNCIDPQRFWDYYTMTDWIVGRTKMQDWRAAIRIWECNDKQHNARCTGTSGNPFWAIAGGEHD